MEEDGKRVGIALKTLAVAVGIGVAGDLLLRETKFGMGVAIFSLLLFGGAAFLYRSRTFPLSREACLLAIPALGFACLFLWREAPELKLLNGVSLGVLIGTIALRARTGNIRVGGIVDYPFRLIGQWCLFISDAIPVANLQGLWPEVKKGKNVKTGSAVMMGILLAAPLILLFGALFVSADAGFEGMVTRAFQFDAENLGSNALVAVACSWLVAGFFHRLYFAVEPPPSAATVAAKPAPLGIIEVGIVLGMLDLLFAAFVATQFRHLFGGNDVVRNTANLGYAQYARRGFFELSTVALLVLPVLLGAHSLLRRDNPKAERTYNLLASILVALVFLVIHSAVLRMRLYVDAYGISQLRIYVLAAIAWIGAVFLWFAGTVLRGRTDRFAFGGVALFLAAVVGLNVVNPDGLVARINTSRPGGNVDGAYLSSLSSDAAPDLIRALPNLNPEAQTSVLTALGQQVNELRERDWRSWTVSGAEAAAVLSGRAYPAPKPEQDHESETESAAAY
jgi:hypothetical protein